METATFFSIVHETVLVFTNIINAIPFKNTTWLMIIMLVFFLWIFGKAHKNPASYLEWEDLIIDAETQRASPYRLGFLLGMMVSTWYVITSADRGTLSTESLLSYLGFLLGGSSWSQFMKTKGSDISNQPKGLNNPGDDLPSDLKP